ncbi:MAG: 2-oxoacid:ferredoxin oxidoreductase subunit beta [Bdellovibrionales bacterium]|nr:2-oxoacid:ferredoxin oxidoreductase subunit beta [Bdellovibrionales bacterium]
MNADAAKKLSPETKKDFTSDQEVRWCPGCGDYAILNAVQKLVPTLGIPKENFVFISGIGCSSRFPYYMDTYGFHTIHGRAPAFATGVKIANPELSVWVITGDGDSLSIGGNHFIHALRRNININILLFNNRIYGLTKGQYSPTSEQGKKTKSTPYGSLDYPISATNLALAAGASFIGRSYDINSTHLQATLEQAAKHEGVSIVEIYQNCNIFNDGAYEPIVNKTARLDQTIELEAGKPMIFGKDANKGIQLQNGAPVVVTLGENGVTEKDLMIHDPSNNLQAFMLTQMDYPEFPVPMGVFRTIKKPTFEKMVWAQNQSVIDQKGQGSLEKLVQGSDTWTVR